MILSIIFVINDYNFSMDSFGKRLKELRLEKGLSQKALAEQIGQAQSTINYWENDKEEPTISGLRKLCDFFDVSADYLICRTDGY